MLKNKFEIGQTVYMPTSNNNSVYIHLDYAKIIIASIHFTKFSISYNESKHKEEDLFSSEQECKNYIVNLVKSKAASQVEEAEKWLINEIIKEPLAQVKNVL